MRYQVTLELPSASKFTSSAPLHDSSLISILQLRVTDGRNAVILEETVAKEWQGLRSPLSPLESVNPPTHL